MPVEGRPQAVPVAIYFSATDPQGVIVECHDRTWFGHIISGHLEMQDREAWVRQTIAQPTGIYQSTQNPARRAFHRPYNFGGQLGSQQVRVIVEYTRHGGRGVVGTIVTAFAATGPKRGETQIWP